MRINFLPMLILGLLLGASACETKDAPSNPSGTMINSWVLTHEATLGNSTTWAPTTRNIQFTIYADSNYKAGQDNFLGLDQSGHIETVQDTTWVIQLSKVGGIPVLLKLSDSPDTLYGYSHCSSQYGDCTARWKFARVK